VTASYPEILDRLGRGKPVSLEAVGGGCIAQARIASFSDGSSVFVKSVQGEPGMFACEAEGLRALAAAGAIRIPDVLAVSEDSLVLECIRSASRKAGFFESFGRRFAKLHAHRGPAVGFPHDNFIGSTQQVNTPLGGSWEAVTEAGAGRGEGVSWPGFFMERRLRFQVKLAGARGHGSELQKLLDRGEDRIAGLLADSVEPPSILHGDLWGGNYMADENGEACLIDPAAYYGHREADLAMTRLFGGFESRFYDAYHEASPLAPGHEERLPIYQLYHLLNHLNLFGRAYYGQSLRILQRYS
jgi:fructosamine-3-kinase